MNLRDLQYLIALSDYQHFGKAADACFVSQPALSMQIKKLERTLDVQLLERTNKSVLFTETGKKIVAYAREALTQSEAIREVAKQAKDPFSGKLHLGIFPTLAPYILPHIFSELSNEFPNLDIYLNESKTEILLEKLKKGQLDCALLANIAEAPDLTHEMLFEEPFYLGVSKKNPLAKQKKIKHTDLQNQTLLLLEEGHCLRDQALSFCEHISAPTAKSFYATSLETLRHMVAADMGMTLVPALACMPNENMTYIPFENSIANRSISLIWRKTSAREALLNRMGDLIKKCVNPHL